MTADAVMGDVGANHGAEIVRRSALAVPPVLGITAMVAAPLASMYAINAIHRPFGETFACHKGYGGFSYRVVMPSDIRFTGAQVVVTPIENAVSSSPWMDVLAKAILVTWTLGVPLLVSGLTTGINSIIVVSCALLLAGVVLNATQTITIVTSDWAARREGQPQSGRIGSLSNVMSSAGERVPKAAAKMRTTPAAAEKQLEAFIDKFDPRNQALIRAMRRALRRRLPTANELVYDNYNFFVIGYCSTERPSDCVVSIAAGANGVALSFYRGATLPDPQKVLLGSGRQNRFIRLESAATLGRPQVEALIVAAVSQAKTPLPASGRGRLIIRSISEKQRPRR